ncbi:MAG: hypothetical protein HY754_08495 [Nitrospirae bacterium]|nr:hypothetical protein [Nitrospirota bacterium]
MNRERRKEAGKVFLDLSKYLATTVAIGSLFVKGSIEWLPVILGGFLAVALLGRGKQGQRPFKHRR